MRRGSVVAVAVIAVCAVALFAGGGSATLPQVTPVLNTSSPCPPTEGRLYCVTATTYTNLSRQGGVEVDVQLQSYDRNTLTHPALRLHYGGCTATGTQAAPCASTVSRDPTATTHAQLTYASFSSDPPSGATCGAATPTSTSPGLVAACSLDNIPAGAASPVIRLYFAVDATPDVAAIVFTAEAAVNERANDNPGAANTESRSVTNEMDFGPATGDASATVALPGNTVKLGTTQLGSAFLRFTAAGSVPYFAEFASDGTSAFCLSGLSCAALQLSASLGGTVSNLILWDFTIVNPPSGMNPSTVEVVHRYDSRPVTANPSTDVFSDATAGAAGIDYTKIDAVRFTGTTVPGGINANVDYFVVSATASTFKVSTTRNGSPVDVTGTNTGPFDVSRVRVIGDQKAEQYTSCTTPPAATKVPSIFASKVSGTTDIHVCLWDSANGLVGPGR